MLRVLLLMAPFTNKVPPLTVATPVLLFAPDRVSVPAPVLPKPTVALPFVMIPVTAMLPAP